jgi:APA family basic amino acid/polyamine antiporter
MLTVVGLMRLRMQSPDDEIQYRTFGKPPTPLLFILGNMWIIIFSINCRPFTALIGLGTTGIGILVYSLFTREAKQKQPLSRSSVA